MNKIDFQAEFEKIARRQGMGDAIAACTVCHKAREILKDMTDFRFEVTSFKNGLLSINFSSSGALTRFNMEKIDFLKKLNESLGKTLVTEVKAVIR